MSPPVRASACWPICPLQPGNWEVCAGHDSSWAVTPAGAVGARVPALSSSAGAAGEVGSSAVRQVYLPEAGSL